MKTGYWAVGFGGFFVVGALMWAPMGALARQSLLDQTAAVGVAGDLNSRSSSNGVSSLNRVRRAVEPAGSRPQDWGTAPPPRPSFRTPGPAAPAGAPAAQAAQATPAAPAAAAPPAPSLPNWDVIPVPLIADAKMRRLAKGRIIFLTGTIEAAESIDGQMAYRMVPAPGLGFRTTDRFLVQIPRGEASMGSEGMAARAFGVFSSETVSRKGVRLFLFRTGQMVSRVAPGPSAPSSAAAAPPPPPSQSFGDPLGGWRFEGTAGGEDGGTAVLMSPSGRPFFLRAGSSFGDGFKVLRVTPGQIHCERNGERMVFGAW